MTVTTDPLGVDCPTAINVCAIHMYIQYKCGVMYTCIFTINLFSEESHKQWSVCTVTLPATSRGHLGY